jgi:hypothetical protein
MAAETHTSPTDALTVVWRRQRLWSAAADKLKKTVDNARRDALIALVAGAVLGAVAAQLRSAAPHLATSFALASAVALAFGAFRRAKVSSTAVRDWTGARAVSEALKAELYPFLAGVGRYQDRAGALLLTTADEVCAEAGALNRHLAGLDPEDRKVPAITDLESYVDNRVIDQIEGYYRRRARELAKSLHRARIAEFVIGLSGALLAGVGGLLGGDQLIFWVGVLTTIAATVTAHSAHSEYEYQQVQYTATADRLESLNVLRLERAEPDPDADARFVDAVEAVIREQNGAWLTKLTTSAGEQP